MITSPKSHFKLKIIFWLTVVSLILLMPFAINNLLHQRYTLAAGCLLVIVILAINFWKIRRGRFSSLLYTLGLTPAIMVLLAISIQQQEIIGILWCYPSVLAFYLILSERQAWVASSLLLVVVLLVASQTFAVPITIRIAVSLIMVVAFSAVFIRVISEQQIKLEKMAITDPLTGLYNRILLQDTLDQAIEYYRRTSQPMTIMTIDLDHFKLINDKFGHVEGDKVLTAVGSYFKDELRGVDKIFRLGGEEFLVLLHNVSAANGLVVAEKIRAALAATQLIPEYQVTVSIGVAALKAGDDADAWRKRSDAHLYQAKMTGRNKVVG